MKEAGGESSKRSNFIQIFKKFDFEGRSFDFYLPDGERYQKSVLGGCVFICMTILFITYASVLFQVLAERTDYNILERRYENELYDSNFSIGTKTGFAIAASLIDFTLVPREDPEIGELYFAMVGWDSPTSDWFYEILKTRPCTEQDFNVDEDSDQSEYGFYKLKDASLLAKLNFSLLKCVDEDFEIRGNHQTDYSRAL